MSKTIFPNDFYTHQQSWRNALVIAEANAKVEAPDVHEKSYWQHELQAFDRAYDQLLSQKFKSGDTVEVPQEWQARTHGKILPQGSNSVNSLIEAGLNSILYLPAEQKNKMIAALNAFKHDCVPVAVSFDDIDASTEREKFHLSVEDKIEVMKGLIAVSRSETAKQQIVDISRIVTQKRANANDDEFDPDATLPSIDPRY